MKILAVLTLLTGLFSCASKPIPLTIHEYDLKGAAKLTVNHLKQKSSRIDIGLLGISSKEDSVVIRKDEVSCGKGDVIGTVTKFPKVDKVPFIILPKSMFLEFSVICSNPNFSTTPGNVYLEIKNIFALNEGMPGKVLASDIKIELK
jgi:hypothetical protein